MMIENAKPSNDGWDSGVTSSPSRLPLCTTPHFLNWFAKVHPSSHSKLKKYCSDWDCENPIRVTRFEEEGGVLDLKYCSSSPLCFNFRVCAFPRSRSLRVPIGLPDRYRGSAWFILSGAHTIQRLHPKDYYMSLLSQYVDAPSPARDEIEKDIYRSFPSHPYFQIGQPGTSHA